jgi:hypothetical protein
MGGSIELDEPAVDEPPIPDDLLGRTTARIAGAVREQLRAQNSGFDL